MSRLHVLVPGPKADEGEYRMWWSWQNLSDDERGRPRRSGFWEGRAWLHFGSATTLHVAWHHGSHLGPGISVQLGGGDGDCDLGFHVGLPFVSYWLTIEDLPMALVSALLPGEWRTAERTGRRYKMTQQHELSLAFHHRMVWWKLWAPVSEWRSTTPRWRDGHFEPARFLFGKERYTTEDIETVETVIPLPEGTYPATVRLFESTWSRPRWPWPRRMIRAEITPKKPAPIPGKGENSWDMEDDAVHSMTMPARTVADAVAGFVQSVLRTREQRGGRDWEPDDD